MVNYYRFSSKSTKKKEKKRKEKENHIFTFYYQATTPTNVKNLSNFFMSIDFLQKKIRFLPHMFQFCQKANTLTKKPVRIPRRPIFLLLQTFCHPTLPNEFRRKT